MQSSATRGPRGAFPGCSWKGGEEAHLPSPGGAGPSWVRSGAAVAGRGGWGGGVASLGVSQHKLEDGAGDAHRGTGVTQVEALGGGEHPLRLRDPVRLEQELQVWWARKSLAHVGPEATAHPVCPCPCSVGAQPGTSG